MELTVNRLWLNDTAVTGVMLIDEAQRFFTLELPLLFDGQPNVPDRCCIPAGTYNVVRYASPKRGYMVPLLVDVPGRSEIEMHIGNYPYNTDGCILIGSMRINAQMIGESEAAFNEFMAEFELAFANEESVTLTIS